MEQNIKWNKRSNGTKHKMDQMEQMGQMEQMEEMIKWKK